MDLFSPLRLGVQVTTDAVKLATAVPRLILHQLHGDNGDGDQRVSAVDEPAGRPNRDGTPSATPDPSGPARGGAGRRPPSPRATPGRATSVDGVVETTAGPPEPTSAAGASGGVAGTAAAPGDAAIAGAPDPTAASSVRPRPPAPQGERATKDVSPTRARRRQATTPKRSEVDRRREQAREHEAAAPADLVETEGSASPGATIHVDEPWAGYDKMKAPEIVGRVNESDAAVKAVVRLYETTHKKRRSIVDATGA
jgi:hypothetical protein